MNELELLLFKWNIFFLYSLIWFAYNDFYKYKNELVDRKKHLKDFYISIIGVILSLHVVITILLFGLN